MFMESAVESTPADRRDWENVLLRLLDDHAMRNLMMLLAWHGDSDGTRVRPGRVRLAAILRCSEKTISRHMKWFIDTGFLVRVKQGNRHTNETDEYRLAIPENVLELLDHPSALAPDFLPKQGSRSKSGLRV